LKKYIWFALVAITIYIFASAIYTQINKSSSSKRIECQKQATTFERVYKMSDIKHAQELLKSGNVSFTSSVIKSHYAKTKLFEYVKLSDMDSVLNTILNDYVIEKKNGDNKLNISYYIYENDVDDPGKKTKKSKLYAGYIVFQFYNPKDELIYQIQIDFMDKKGKDLPQRIKCAIESFITIKG
jgi:hypothetical protein